MDYSLLFAVEKNANFKPGTKSTGSKTVVSDDNEENQMRSKIFSLYF